MSNTLLKPSAVRQAIRLLASRKYSHGPVNKYIADCPWFDPKIHDKKIIEQQKYFGKHAWDRCTFEYTPYDKMIFWMLVASSLFLLWPIGVTAWKLNHNNHEPNVFFLDKWN